MAKRKKIEKAIKSLEKLKDKHLVKLKEEPDSAPATTGYWDKEISTIENNIKKLEKKFKNSKI